VGKSDKIDVVDETPSVEPEPVEPLEGDSAAAEPSVETLQHELDEALTKVDEARDEMLRARAELENVRKRARRDVESAHKYGTETLITELLPVKDSMDLGYQAAQTATEVGTICAGMELTLKMFEDALEKCGVGAVDPDGERFDPEFHQAMMMETTADVEPGTVLRVIQKGYVLNARLIRPAMVVVAKADGEEGS
jgi:molecular chaperone GrpE